MSEGNAAKVRKPNPWTATNTPTSWCALHGGAFTFGCPGCEEAEDYADAEEVRRRTRWWKLSQWCPHWWRTLEPKVKRCRICGCITFEEATMEQLQRWLVDG